MDADKSGEIDLEEFSRVCRNEDESQVKKLFAMFDRDGGGTITLREMTRSLRTDADARALAMGMSSLKTWIVVQRKKNKLTNKKSGGGRGRRKTVSNKELGAGARRTSIADKEGVKRLKDMLAERANKKHAARKQILESGVLQRVKAFKKCKISDEGMAHMADVLQLEEYKAGRTICAEGDEGHKLYLVTHGAVRVVKDGKTVSVMEEGKSFGEIALMQDDCKRTATIEAETDCVLLSLSRDDFEHVLSEHGGRRAARHMDSAAEALLLGDRMRRRSTRERRDPKKKKKKRRGSQRKEKKKATKMKRKKSKGDGSQESPVKVRKASSGLETAKQKQVQQQGQQEQQEYQELQQREKTAKKKRRATQKLAMAEAQELMDAMQSGGFELAYRGGTN